MRAPWSRVLLLALAAGALVGCASSEPVGGAGQAVQEFYRHLNDGQYSVALSLYNAETRGVLEDPNAASDSAFADWAKLETKGGKVDRVDVVQQDETGEATASVQYRVVYSDGSSVERKVSMTFEAGKWKLGWIG